MATINGRSDYILLQPKKRRILSAQVELVALPLLKCIVSLVQPT